MQFDVWAQTDVGLKRDNNQDAILVDRDLNLFIVADGMGGHKGGEVAAALAVETVQEFVGHRIQDKKQSPRHILMEAYREASSRIHHKSTYESPELMGMGTTMVAFWGVRGKAYIANVGDSRAYMYLGADHLWQLTEDHSLINEQVKAGVITEEEAPHVVGRNVITRSVGFEQDVMADVIERDLRPGESYLLCSDGLSGLVEPQNLLKAFKETSKQALVERCINDAKSVGGDDNISVILICPTE